MKISSLTMLKHITTQTLVYSIAVLLLITIPLDRSTAQVGEVTKKSKENKASKDTENNESDSFSNDGVGFGVNIFVDLFELTFRTIPMAQANVLSFRHEDPWITSLEANIHGGFYSHYQTLMFLPSIRGNWGIFSTEARINRIFDKTGNFQTIDWQIVQLNILPRQKFNLRFGIGLSYESKTDEVYPDHLIGLDFHLLDRSLNPTIEYRWSKDHKTEIVPRSELNIKANRRIMKSDSFDINLMVGLVYQKYFESVNFYFLQTGLSFFLN